MTNLDNRFDVNADGRVDALDALILINDINANGQRDLTYGTLQAPFLDVTRDGTVSAGDVLGVINVVNSSVAGGSGGEGEGAAFIADDLSAAAAPAVTSEVAVRRFADAASSTRACWPSRCRRLPPARFHPQRRRLISTLPRATTRQTTCPSTPADLAEAALAGTGGSVRRAIGDDVADLALDGVLADLAADQDRSQETSADGFFADLAGFSGGWPE